MKKIERGLASACFSIMQHRSQKMGKTGPRSFGSRVHGNGKFWTWATKMNDIAERSSGNEDNSTGPVNRFFISRGVQALQFWIWATKMYVIVHRSLGKSSLSMAYHKAPRGIPSAMNSGHPVLGGGYLKKPFFASRFPVCACSKQDAKFSQRRNSSHGSIVLLSACGDLRFLQ